MRTCGTSEAEACMRGPSFVLDLRVSYPLTPVLARRYRQFLTPTCHPSTATSLPRQSSVFGAFSAFASPVSVSFDRDLKVPLAGETCPYN